MIAGFHRTWMRTQEAWLLSAAPEVWLVSAALPSPHCVHPELKVSTLAHTKHPANLLIWSSGETHGHSVLPVISDDEKRRGVERAHASNASAICCFPQRRLPLVMFALRQCDDNTPPPVAAAGQVVARASPRLLQAKALPFACVPPLLSSLKTAPFFAALQRLGFSAHTIGTVEGHGLGASGHSSHRP